MYDDTVKQIVSKLSFEQHLERNRLEKQFPERKTGERKANRLLNI